MIIEIALGILLVPIILFIGLGILYFLAKIYLSIFDK